MDVLWNLTILMLMVLIINVGAIVRLKLFGRASMKVLKIVLIISNFILFWYFIIYFYVLKME